jgi:hypothetical protein
MIHLHSQHFLNNLTKENKTGIEKKTVKTYMHDGRVENVSRYLCYKEKYI